MKGIKVMGKVTDVLGAPSGIDDISPITCLLPVFGQHPRNTFCTLIDAIRRPYISGACSFLEAGQPYQI